MAEKIPACDAEAARLLSLQTRETPHARRWDTLLCVLFVGVIGIFTLLHWLLPDRDMSETENRTLTQFPPLSAKSLTNGSFTADIADYMADQFPARDFFINLKAASETVLLRGGNNGVIFAAGDNLITRTDLPNLENMESNLHSMQIFADWCKGKNIPTTAAITGRNADVMDHTLPAAYGSYFSDRLWQSFAEMTADASYPVLNLRDPLREKAAQGEYVYYRTDHHWTTLGAYYGYAAIMDSIGTEPYPLTDFERRTVSLSFLGTTWSTAGAGWINGDEMEYFRFAEDDQFTTTVKDDGTSFPGFYEESYLAKKDKYSSFLSGNHALVTVTQNNPTADRETLLLIKDSFAHAAAPFLARHYDLVIVDLRYYKQRTISLVDEYGVDRVLYLMNIDSLTGSTVLKMLEAGTT